MDVPKFLFLNKNAGFRTAALLNRDSSAGIFLWILEMFQKKFLIEQLRTVASVNL